MGRFGAEETIEQGHEGWDNLDDAQLAARLEVKPIVVPEIEPGAVAELLREIASMVLPGNNDAEHELLVEIIVAAKALMGTRADLAG